MAEFSNKEIFVLMFLSGIIGLIVGVLNFSSCNESFVVEEPIINTTINKSVFMIDDVSKALDKSKVNVSATGIYRREEFFCVITANRSLESISKTTFHELAHVFNYRDSEHFKTDFLGVD